MAGADAREGTPALQRYIDDLLSSDGEPPAWAAAHPDPLASSMVDGFAADAVAAGTAAETAPLLDAGADGTTSAEAAVHDVRLRFLMVSAGGLRVALPAEAIGEVGDAAEHDGEGVIDLGAVLRGQPSGGRPPRCRLVLSAYPGRLLAVDAVDGPLDVSPESVRHRTSRAQRPWLAGMIEAHRAIVVAVDELITKEYGRGS